MAVSVGTAVGGHTGSPRPPSVEGAAVRQGARKRGAGEMTSMMRSKMKLYCAGVAGEGGLGAGLGWSVAAVRAAVRTAAALASPGHPLQIWALAAS